MAKSFLTFATPKLWPREVTREAVRLSRTRGAEPSRSHVAEFAHYTGHRGRSSFSRRHAVSGSGPAAHGIPALEIIRTIRHRRGELSSRPSRLQPRSGDQRAGAIRESRPR